MAAWTPNDKVDAGWKGFSLNVPGTTLMLANDEKYGYKLPYTVPYIPCCTRIHPMLYCCDVYCCQCANLASKAGSPPFMDVVNQEDGRQLRYRVQKLCCRVPKVLTFADGQLIGHASRTMRCGNRCLTCLEDIRGKDVLQVALHNETGKQVARIDRNGKGCCCDCSVNFPMQCKGCCFICCTLTAGCRPSLPTPFCGLLDCDPVCCDDCVRGPLPVAGCYDLPCCCIGLCAAVPQCWCCMPQCRTRDLQPISTVMLKDYEVVDADSRQPVGKMQSVYRGNNPSAFQHNPFGPFSITGQTRDSTTGALLSGLAAGIAYPLGGAIPAFAGLQPKPEGTSPDFTGWLFCHHASQARKLAGIDGNEAALRDDLIVGTDMVFGTKLNGFQVKGWKLVEMGYYTAPFNCCGFGFGGKAREARTVKTLQEVKDLVTSALEMQIGEYGTIFHMRFLLPDPEKPVVKSDMNILGNDVTLDKKFNPPRAGYGDFMEEVAMSCVCHRLCRGCQSAPDTVVLCKCPVYARKIRPTTKVAPLEEKPPQVVMMGPRAAADAAKDA